MLATTDALLQTGGVGLIVGALAWMTVAPLTASIPHGLEKKWQQESAEQASKPFIRDDEPPAWLSARHQALICMLAAVMGALVVHLRGMSGTTLVLLAYLLGVLLLAAINWRTALLPDTVVLPLAWAGLLFNAWSGRGVDPIYGATLGFCVPWFIYWIIKLKSGADAIGFGDMKTFGMAGAWFGVTAMPVVFVVFFATLITQQLAVWLTGLRLSRQLPSGHLPTGVAHCVSSIAWAVGVQFAHSP